MNGLEALIALNMINGIGSVRLKRLVEFFGRPENIFQASEEKLTGACGIPGEIAAAICSFTCRPGQRDGID